MQFLLLEKLDAMSPSNWDILREKATVFHFREYVLFQNSMGNEVWCFVALSNDRLVGALPVVIRRVLFFKYGLIPVEGWIDSTAEIGLDQFYREFLESIPKKIMWVDASSVMARFRGVESCGVRTAPFGTFQVNLKTDSDALWNNIHPKHKNSIRSAERKGVRAGPVEDANTVYAVLKETHRRASIPFLTKSEWDLFNQHLVQTGYCQIYQAVYEGKIQGCIVIPFSKTKAYYLYGGSIEKPFPGSMNLLHWHVIRNMKEKGVGLYDFGGSRVAPEEGSKAYTIKRFKERFGGEFHECFLWDKVFNGSMFRLAEAIKKIRSFVKREPYRASLIDQEIKRNWG